MCPSAVSQVLVTVTVTITLLLALPCPSSASELSEFNDCLNTHTSSCDGSEDKFEWTCAKNPAPTCMSNAPITKPYVLLTKDPVQFISHPQDSVLHSHSSISLNCRVTGLSCFGQDDCPQYEWLHDNVTIPASDYTSTVNGSVLRIGASEASRAGQYTCVVHYGNSDMFTVASFPASVGTPLSTNLYFNWSSEVNEDFVVKTANEPFQTVTMQVPIGTNVILDCTVVKPISSDCHVWSASNSNQFFYSSTCAKNFTQSSGAVSENPRNIVALPSGNLAIYNFSQELKGSYLCLMKRGTVIQQDKLYKLVAANSSSTALKFDASPQSQTVVEGSNVTLYCTASGGRPPLVYKWWRGSTPISSHNMPYGSSVLFLEQVNLNHTGDYSCSVAGNGGAGFINKTAYLKVLASVKNVSIKLLSSNIHLNFTSSGDILLPPALNAASLTLKCNLPLEEDDPKLTYTWLFRRQPVNKTSGDLFVANGSLLHVTVAKQSDVRSVYGSVQCLVEGVGGRDSVTVRILENGKPNPPGPILAHKSLPQIGYDYHYKLNWTESHSTVPVSDYQLNIYMYEIGVCSVTVSSSCLVYDGLCNIILKNKDDTYYGSLAMRVLAKGEGGVSTSDYSVYSHEAPNNKYCLVFDEKIPPVTDLKESLVAHQESRVYTGSLSWKPLYQSYSRSFTEEDENQLKYAYYIGLTCDGTKLIDMKGSVINSPVLDRNHTLLPPLSCAMHCSWFVSVSRRSSADGDSSDENTCFTTPAFSPNVSGTLQSVYWTDHSGSSFDLIWQPPSKDWKSSSCLLEDTNVYNLTVSYQHSTNVKYFVNVMANYSDKVESIIRIPINQSGSCWIPFTVSVQFSNSAGLSPAGKELTLPSPQRSDITGFSSVTYDAKTNFLNWTMDAGMRCFFERDSPYIRRYTISVAIPNTNASKPNCSSEQKSNWTSSPQYFPRISFLKPDVQIPSITKWFCMTVEFVGNQGLLRQQTQVVMVTNDGTASPPVESSSRTPSPTSHFAMPTSPPTYPPANNNQITILLIVLLVTMLLLVAVAFAVGLYFFLKKCKNCTKGRYSIHIEQRTHPEGSSPIDVLIPKDDNLYDSKSEHTACNYLMGRFLEDTTKDHEQDDYLESVSVANDDMERAELNRASEASVKTGQTVEVELHNFTSGQEREIDDRTGKKVLAENLEKSGKVTSWKEEPKKNSRERLSLKTHQPHTTINYAPPTLDQVKQIANTLQHSAPPSTKTYSSVTSDYLANSCSTVGSSSSSQLGAEQRGAEAVAALSEVLSYMPSKAPLLQSLPLSSHPLSSACPSDVSPARSGYLESADVTKSTTSPFHSANRQQTYSYAQSENPREEVSLDLPPFDNSWAEENEQDITPTAERSGYSISMQPRQQPNADGYLTERSLDSFGTSTPLRLSTSSLKSSLPSARGRYYSDQQTASKDYRKHSLQEPRPVGDGYLSEETLRHHSASGLSLPFSKYEGSYLPHSPFKDTPRQFSVADSAMASASPPGSLSQASSEQSVFLPETEAEPLLSNPLPPPITTHSTELPRRRSDCSSGIFSSPTSPGVRSNTSSYFNPSTSYLSFPISLPPNKTASEKQQRPLQLPMRQTDNLSRTQPHSATGMGLGYSYGQRHRYSPSTPDALSQRRASGGYPTSSASSSRTLTPYSGATNLPSLSPTRRTSLPSSPSYSSSYSASYQRPALGSLSSAQTPTTPNNQGPSFLTYMYSKKPQTPTSNQVFSTAGPVGKPHPSPPKQTCLRDQALVQENSEPCKAKTLAQSNSHESLSSSFDSSYSPGSSLDDISCIDSSSSYPQSSCPPPTLSSSFSAKPFSRSSTKDSDDMWEHAMKQTVEEHLERQHLLK